MARRAEATHWMLIKQDEKRRYVSVSKVGSGRYAPNIEGLIELGPYYLCYKQDGKRKWECIGTELALALNEQGSHKTAPDRGKPPERPEGRKSLSPTVESYLAEVSNRRGNKAAKRTK